MPETTTLQHTFAHPWSHISIAYWLKYPSPQRPDVLSVDLIDREFDPETGVLTAKRLVTSQMTLPTWLRSLVPASVECHALEEAVIDPRNKVMVLKGRNVTFSDYLKITEKCTYSVDREDDQWTCLQQEAETSSALFWGVARSVESWSLQNFTEKAILGRKIMDETSARVCNDLARFGRVQLDVQL